jgi:hypothetical protein
LSFVRSEQDVARLRQELQSRNAVRGSSSNRKPQAVQNLDAIVAPPTLGWWREATSAWRWRCSVCRRSEALSRLHRPTVVIAATQMLNSMEHSSRPRKRGQRREQCGAR